MARQTGVTTETAKRMIMDAGAVYLNYGETSERLFGATREGSEFTIEQEVRVIEADGLRGPTKGFRRIISETVTLTVNLLEMTTENVVDSLLGASVSSTIDTDTITRSLLMSDIEYLDNIALVADYSGSEGTAPVVILLKNALQDGNFSLNATDREESVAELTFTAHIDPSESLDVSPFEIRFPIIS